MTAYASRLAPVRELLGPDAVLFESRTTWEIGICKNHVAGPPYDLEIYGEGETFEAAWTQASRAAAKIGGRAR